MAGRATYTEADKARAYVTLQANEGNVRRTARDLQMPAPTVRLWRNQWRDFGPPNLEDPIVQAELRDFLVHAEQVRNHALVVLESKVPNARPSELVAIIGMLDDKITRAKGLATGRVEHVHSLPSPEDIRNALAAGIVGAIEAARTRHAEIIEADIIEQAPRELEPAR